MFGNKESSKSWKESFLIRRSSGRLVKPTADDVAETSQHWSQHLTTNNTGNYSTPDHKYYSRVAKVEKNSEFSRAINLLFHTL